jgi:hypothetical protein
MLAGVEHSRRMLSGELTRRDGSQIVLAERVAQRAPR